MFSMHLKYNQKSNPLPLVLLHGCPNRCYPPAAWSLLSPSPRQLQPHRPKKRSEVVPFI